MKKKVIFILIFLIPLVLGIRVAMSPEGDGREISVLNDYTDDAFEFGMIIPEGYRLEYFPVREGYLMRIGFFEKRNEGIPDIHFWLTIVHSEKPIAVLIQNKIEDRVVMDFPREGFSRSFFRLEGERKYIEVMNTLLQSIHYEKPVVEEVEAMPTVPDVILKNLEKPTLMPDIGNTCVKGSDCESGICMAPQDGSDEGACYGYLPLVGCVQVIEEGVVSEVCS